MNPLRRSIAMTALLISLGLAAATKGFAQESAPALQGRAVVRIRIEAPRDADMVRIRQTISVREGDRYAPDAVGRDIVALYRLGEFADVRVEPLAQEDGVELVYRLVARPRIAAVRFEAADGFRIGETALRDSLKLTVGGTLTPHQLQSDLEALRRRLRSEGYLFGEVVQETQETAAGTEILYRVHFGPIARIESLRFEGNDAVPDSVLRKAMLSVDTSFFSVGKFDPALLESDMLAIREVVRRKGYLDAVAGHEILYDAARERAYLVIRIWQGPLYRVRSVRVRNAAVFSAEEVLAAMSLREGAPYAAEVLDGDIAAIKAMYGRKGHIRASVRPTPTISEKEAEVALLLDVEEGAEYRVGKVVIRGNRYTKDHVIRRGVALAPGDLADSDALKTTRRRLSNTGLFGAGESGAEAVRAEFLDTNAPDVADLLVEVNEGGLGHISLGAGWNSDLGLVGNVTVQFNNFDILDVPQSWRDLVRGGAWTGGGERLTLSLSPGATYRDYRLQWFTPSVYDSDYSLGFGAYLRDYAWDGYYDETRYGVSATVGRKLFEDVSVSLTGRVEKVEIGGLDDNPPADAIAAKGSHLRNTLTLEVAYDTRDDVFLPTEGWRVAAEGEMAGTLLGGDVDYVSERFQARKWWTLWEQRGQGKHTLHLGGEASGMQSTESGRVPLFDRFFLGGMDVLRGFAYRGAGPIDEDVRKQIGGQYRLLFNTEYEAPLYRDFLRGVAFVDGGLLAQEVSDFRLDDLRMSAGIGLRLRPVVYGGVRMPINIFLSLPVLSRSEDDLQALQVSIGTGFAF